jgi:glycosyltransferase involved in cell wall biosynthesis
MNITIIVCCYNSNQRIQSTLEYLANQDLQDLKAEIILVDNNCSDNTVEVAQRTWLENGEPFKLQVIKEENAGLSYARKTGVALATGEIIIFCDDDNWLDKNYCRLAYELMKKNPDIGVLGGRSEAKTDGEFPFWFSSYQGSYAVGTQSIESGYVCERKYLWGAGMVIRLEEINNIYKSGFNSFLTGRKGLELSSGEDSEICRWFLLIGKRLYYEEELKFIHYIDKHRVNREYLKRLHDSFFLSERALYFYELFSKLKHNRVGWYSYFKLFLKYHMGKSTDQEEMILEIFNKTKFLFHKDTLELKKALTKYKSTLTVNDLFQV